MAIFAANVRDTSRDVDEWVTTFLCFYGSLKIRNSWGFQVVKRWSFWEGLINFCWTFQINIRLIERKLSINLANINHLKRIKKLSNFSKQNFSF